MCKVVFPLPILRVVVLQSCIVPGLILLHALNTHAQVRLPAEAQSSRSEMQTQLKFGKIRKKDFLAEKAHEAKEEIIREKAVANELKAQAREVEHEEKLRARYVSMRDAHPPLANSEKLEKIYEAQAVKADERTDRLREKYLREQNQIASEIERQAYIDPADEYDLHPFSPSSVAQEAPASKPANPPVLKKAGGSGF